MKQETEKRVCRRAGCVSRKGFSFVEIILSTFILSIGISATFVALGKGLGTSLESQNVIIASGLAQEGTELVLNVRDNAFASGTGTDGFHKFPVNSGGNHQTENDCRIDYNDSAVFSYANDSDRGTHIDCYNPNPNEYDLTIVNGFYSHNGVAGKFKRRIYLDWDSSSQTYTVFSAVWWGMLPGTTFNNVSQLTTHCTIANKCVLARVTLAPWN